MWNTIKQLWSDEAGFLLSAELVLISTILTLGLVVGLSSVSAAINEELWDVANAFSVVNQGYRYSELRGSDRHDHGSNGGGGQWDIVCASASRTTD